MNSTICNAIRECRLLRLNYDWGYRAVEPHAYGLNDNGHELLRAYQIGGTSQSGETVGWKLFRVDEISGLHTTEDHFSGPRQGYKRGDKALDQTIYCQL